MTAATLLRHLGPRCPTCGADWQRVVAVILHGESDGAVGVCERGHVHGTRELVPTKEAKRCAS